MEAAIFQSIGREKKEAAAVREDRDIIDASITV